MAVRRPIVSILGRFKELPTTDTLPGFNPVAATLTDGATVTIACDASKAHQTHVVTLGGNRTLTWSGVVDGMTGTLAVIQDATGSRTLTTSNPSGFTVKKRGGTLTLTTAAAAHDVISWVAIGTIIYVTVGAFS